MYEKYIGERCKRCSKRRGEEQKRTEKNYDMYQLPMVKAIMYSKHVPIQTEKKEGKTNVTRKALKLTEDFSVVKS